MARQIIVLDAQQDSRGVILNLTIACWLAAPATRTVPIPNFASQVPPVAKVTWGITAAELSALQAGTLVEQVATVAMPVAAATVQNLEAALQAEYTALQTALTNQVFAGGIHFVGASWDGTTWSQGP